MSIKLNSSGGGSVTLQEPVTASTRTLDLPDATGTVVAANSSGNVSITSLTVDSNNISAVNSLGFRNRIINGDMRIDQRNAGASVTPVSGQYLVDRFQYQASQASKVTAQQNAGAVTPPAGFTNYLGITSSSAYSVTGNDSFQVTQIVEGFNIADFAWGTANAQPATLSFWVRSSLTGTFGGSIATTKTAVWVMPFSYTISSANTWTYITVPIPAATSTGGTNNDNTAGVFVRFGLGAAGTAAGGAAGTWTSAGNYVQPSGTVSVVGTNGATFYITGVQLEAGTVASPFERRDYGRELIMCQRYLPISASGTATGAGPIANLQWSSSTAFQAQYYFQVTPRVPPTGITISSASHFLAQNTGTGNPTVTAISFSEGTLSGCSMTGTVASGGGSAGSSGYLRSNSTASALIQFTGCEL